MNELKFYTVQEVADIFKVSKQTVYNWFRDGQITGSRATPRSTIRFSEQDISDFHKRIQTEN